MGQRGFAMQTDTELELKIEFKLNEPDLNTVLAIYVCIWKDFQAARYLLQYNNFYFVTHTTIVLMIQYCLLQCSTAPDGSLQWDTHRACCIKASLSRSLEVWNYLGATMKNTLLQHWRKQCRIYLYQRDVGFLLVLK
jgi:hypothetical protein